MATILGRAGLGGLRRSDLRGTLRLMVGLRRYYRSGGAARDPYEERKAKTTETISAVLAALSGDDLPAAELIVEYFAEDLAHSVEREPPLGEDRPPTSDPGSGRPGAAGG